MDPDSPPGVGAPLQPASSDRVNQQRDSSLFYSASSRPDRHGGHSRDSSVHDKISQYNTLATQSRHLERKTADAALQRAMVGREEAETDMRRYRDEADALRKLVEEGRERERRVGERLETVMENYGHTKDTYAHTQALWEKEIRRARKEAFKSQSTIVKLQEEVKSSRGGLKTTEDSLEREKERSKVREQEAFAARYQLVGLQEQLEKALEQIKVVEQERDVFKTLAKNEEVARIAAEGRLPLPPPTTTEDEFSSPKKARVSLSTIDIQSSAASEAEIEELSERLLFETHRANRAIQQVDFLKIECQLNCCPSAKVHNSHNASLATPTPQPQAAPAVDIPTVAFAPVPLPKQRGSQTQNPALPKLPQREPRRSTIFIPSEGTFRTVSEDDTNEILQEATEEAPAAEEGEKSGLSVAPATSGSNPRAYVRTPSADPPAFALIAQERASLQSLLDAPHKNAIAAAVVESSPPAPITPAEQSLPVQAHELSPNPVPETAKTIKTPITNAPDQHQQPTDTASPKVETRPHTSASVYTTVTKTTKVPLRETGSNPKVRQRQQKLHTPKSSSFDVNNPALTPTMTREQALAQIRERRGRARSMVQGTMTPRRNMVQGTGERRDVSAPVARTTSRATSRATSRVR